MSTPFSPRIAGDPPFDLPEFRSDLAELASSVRQDWQRWAEQAIVLARLAKLIPASTRSDDPTWSSFVREVAVARRCSDQAAGKEIYLAVALVTSHPRTLELLRSGQLPAYTARVLIEETAGCSPEVARAVEAELADRACQLTP